MDFLKQIPLNEAIDQFCNPLRESSSHVEALNSIILSVHRNEVDLEGIVRSLGEYLTSVDDRVRARGTLCLSELLTRLPKLSLNQKSITTLFTFYTDRMRDLPCVAEVMTGLYAISSHHMLTEGQEMLFFESLIKEEVVVQAFSVTTRNRVFQVIQTLIQKYLHLLRHEINKVARAAVRAFDGEKDPRNLMIIFPLSSIFFEEDIDEENTEELFDVISCYFPILFKPGPNDPYGITREQLVSSLRDAMTKDAKVAKHAIPFLLKKLSSALVETKVEALQTIVRFFQQVPMESLSSFWGDVWVAIRTETMDYQTSQASSSANSSVFETTLETFHKIIKFVPKFHDDIFQTKETLFPADYLLADCLDCVKGTNTYPFLYYAPLVDGALSAGGADMVSHFYSKIFEPMLSNLESLVTQSKHMKESHFLSMIPFLKNAKDESIHPFNVIPVVHRALDLCFQIIGDVSTPPSVSKAAIDVIYTFLSQLSHPAVRKEQCQRFLVYCVQEATNPLSKHPREVYAKVLSELSTSYPDLFLSVAIDKVMIKLQQLLQGPPDAELESLTDFVQSLSVNTLDIFAPTIERLSTILTGLITQDSTEVSRLHIARIISLLSSMIEKGSSLVSTETREIPATFCMSPLVAAMESPPLSRDVNIISLLVEFALLSCRILSLSQQQELVRWASTSIVDHMQEDSGDGTNTRLLIFSAILSNARPEALPMAMEQVIDHYQGHIDKCCSLDTIRLAVQTIAAILNKAPSEVSDVQILESARSWLNLSKQEAIGSDYRQTLVASIGWLLKAAMMRHSKATDSLLELVFSQFDGGLSHTVPAIFDIAFSEHAHALCKESYSNIKVLYRQKYFNICVSKLAPMMRDPSRAQAKPNILESLAIILSHQPPAVVSAQDDALAICIQALQSTHPATYRRGIRLIEIISSANPDECSKHLHSIIPTLLRALSTSSSETKVAAISTLQRFAKLPNHKIVPYRGDVVESLTVPLSDPVRSVRRACALCRNAWITMDQAE